MVTSRPPDSALARRIEQCRDALVRRRLTIYRSCSPKYATEQDLITGQGSRLHGGRWNPIGTAAVYGSTTPETTLAESLAYVRYMGFDAHEAMPRVFAAIEIRLKNVLDLTDGAIRRRIRVAMARMVADDWRKLQGTGHESLCQCIGRVSSAAGFEGLLVPSVVDPEGTSVVIFPDNLLAASSLRVINAAELLPATHRGRH